MFFFPDLWASGEVMGSSQHGTVAGKMEHFGQLANTGEPWGRKMGRHYHVPSLKLTARP